ncbi:MAG: hypothetical protein CME19_18340 [Gemmatimonadetes bacterium]|nr:hypothetical protein [Gemmatimonadota bacterium]|tara:strand:- start:2264 stop:3580 length:1317 start_codon:yes stop_codon:yes gene_type:complete
MTSVCFVVPSWHYWTNPLKLQPMWEMYYATVCQAHFDRDDARVVIEDLRGHAADSLSEAVSDVGEHDVYAYWIMKTGDSVEIANIVSLIRDRHPAGKHVAGGTHVDMLPEECANVFDAIIVGPGENSFKQIVEDTRSGRLEKVYEQPYREVPFTDTPFPDRSLLPVDRVVNPLLFEQYGGVPATSLYFSRGCVYKCAFCVYNVPSYLQVRSREMMRDEIQYLKDGYGVKGLNFRDEVAIHPNAKISTTMFEVLGEADIVWRGQTTTVATYEQLKQARDSGCLELSIGVETVDDQVMQIIDKAWQTESQIRSFMENAKKLGIRIKMCLIFGLPGEPPDIVERSIRFIEETEPDYISLSGFCPVPGSPIFNNPEQYGIKFIDRDWAKHAHLLYRFSDEEEVGLPFEYEAETQWGKAFSREQIKENIRQTQRWLETREMVY